MNKSKNISVVGSFNDISSLFSKMAANEHVKDKSVHMRYMGGTSVGGEIKAEVCISSDDECKLNSVLELSKKGIV